MRKILLKSKDKEKMIIEVSSETDHEALEEAREYVRKNLKLEDQWCAYDYHTRDWVGATYKRTVYAATDWEGVEFYDTVKEADGKHTFYTREEALAKRKSYEAEAERLLDEKEKQLKEAGANLVVIMCETYEHPSERWVAIRVEIEGYEFIRRIRNN